MSLPCLILAAGFGTRMGALVAERPKPLIPVAGRALLDHALDLAETAQAPKIAVNAHYKAAQIAAHLKGHRAEVLIEAPEILDSGGAVKNAVAHLPSGPIATLNADAVWTGANPLAQLNAAFRPSEMGALLLLVPLADAVGRTGGADFAMARDGRIALDKTGGAYVYTGAQILDPRPITEDPRRVFSLRDHWQAWQGEGRLFGLVHRGRWADVGHPAGIAAAEAMVKADVV